MNGEIGRAQEWAEKLQKKNGKGEFTMTGGAVNVGGKDYPKSENWQKAIGELHIWGSASVTSKGESLSMRITIHAKDRWDFNKGMDDIATGTPDSVNGRFAELGWAKPFMTSGTVTRTVTWTRGQLLGTTSVSKPGGR
ncbi:hypothetical protein [Streptomyces sp. NPDC005859]|uniref:hypothetical protein n=1 Tax=Streptomyces sp. NPDC005859 TaxID=3157170 RepID=UPI0033F20F59